jgi:hypothetical protein
MVQLLIFLMIVLTQKVVFNIVDEDNSIVGEEAL